MEITLDVWQAGFILTLTVLCVALLTSLICFRSKDH